MTVSFEKGREERTDHRGRSHFLKAAAEKREDPAGYASRMAA
jgi:hypothetical protein